MGIAIYTRAVQNTDKTGLFQHFLKRTPMERKFCQEQTGRYKKKPHKHLFGAFSS
jgi:hypothetical protein